MADLLTPLSRANVLVGRVDVEMPTSTEEFGLRIAPEAVRRSLRMSEADAHQLGSLAGFEIDQPINSVTGSEFLSFRLGPDEWLLVAPVDQHDLDAVMTEAIGSHRHAFTDVSHRSVAIEVSGARARDVLNTGCPLDLGSRGFPVGYATRTIFAKAEIVLSRPGPGEHFRIECWRSFARYLRAFLIDSARLQGMG